MPNKTYFKEVYNGDILPVLFSSFPLIIWIYYVFYVPLPWILSLKHSSPSKYFAILCIFIPFIIVGWNFVTAQYNSDYDFNTAELAPGWQFCFSTDSITKKDQENGVVGAWDLKCGIQEISMNNTIVKDLVTRFYYLSNALFIFVIVIYNSLAVDILKSRHITQTLIFCLLMGIIGMLPSIFNTYYLRTFLFNRMISTFLSLNIAAFFLLILGILVHMKKK